MSPSPTGAPPLGRKQRLLLEVERFARRRYGWVFAVSLIAVVVASWLGSRLTLESDTLRLIPEGNRKVDTFRAALREFGAIDYLLVLLTAEEGQGPDELEDFADLLAEKLLASSALVETVEYRFQPDPRFLRLFSENALLFVPPSELGGIEAKLTDEAIRRQIRENRLVLASPAASLAEGLLLNDPLGLMPFFVERLLGSRGALEIDVSSGYYLSKDGRNLLLLVKPTHPSQDLAFDRRLVDEVRRLAEATRRELSEDGGEGGILLSLAGNHAVTLEEASLIRQDIVRNALLSFAAVTLLYWLCYRRVAALLYSSVPLVVGQALTFGLAWMVLGSLTSASAALPALLMGLGTDFTIVMYSRYVEERRAGASLAEATEAMVGETGLGVFTGAITSAATFLAMCVSSFPGLFDLGFLIGTGILLCAIVIVFLLPAMIAWYEGKVRRAASGMRRLHLQSFGLERLIPFSARHRAAVLSSVVALVAVGVVLALRLDFDDSIQSLRSNRSDSTRTQDRIAATFGASLSYMMAIAEGRTLDEAVNLAARVRDRVTPLVSDGTIGSYQSILDYLPPIDQQQRIIDASRGDSSQALDPERVTRAFLRGLEENGFRREPFEDYLDRMRRFLRPARPITLEDLEGKGLGRIVDRYVHRGEDRVRIVTYLYPTDPRWKRQPPPGLVGAITRGDEGIVVTGTNVVSQELRHLFTRDALRSVALGLALVFVLLLVDFRSLKLTAISMAQLLSGVVLMLGTMRLLDIPINYASAFVATMIMGVGIDYSIHLVHRLNVTGGDIEHGLIETGKAVVLAAMTNVAGFGTLILGNYPALRSFGLVALLGSVWCLLTSLTLVPALMAGGRGAPTPRRR